MAKTIKKTTDKEAKKELRKSGALKGLSRKDKKMAIKKAGFEKRQDMRAGMKAARKEDADIRKMFADRRREEARRGGQRLAYDVGSKGRYQGTPSEVMQGIRRTSGSFGSQEGKRIMENNERAMLNRKNKANAKVGEMFEIIDSKGKKQKVMKKKAMYGSKVKAVKKAKNGGKITDPPKKTTKSKFENTNVGQILYNMDFEENPNYEPGFVAGSKQDLENPKYIKKKSNPGDRPYDEAPDISSPSDNTRVKKVTVKAKKAKNGGALKSVPSDAKGLSKLPKSVRNKMGYAKYGSKVKAMYGAKMKKK